MDTDSLYLALAEKELEDYIRPEMRAEWQRLRSDDCVNSFTADDLANFFPRTCLIDLCPRGNFQRHKYNNLDKETCIDFCINFFKPCGRTNSHLQLWFSSPCCIFYWSSWKFSFPKKSEMKSFFLDIETTKRIKLDSILEKLTQRHNRR